MQVYKSSHPQERKDEEYEMGKVLLVLSFSDVIHL